MSANRLTPLKIVAKPVPTDIRQALEISLLHCEAPRLSPRTTDFYRWQLDKALSYLAEQGVNALAELTPTHIRSYLVSLQNRDLSDASQHSAARALRAWLNFCVREELTSDSPTPKVRMPKRGNEILLAFTPDDVQQLLRACRELRETGLVVCLLDTGCRAAELCALNVGHVDTSTGEVAIKQGKGRRDRLVFIGVKARKALRTYLMSRQGTTSDEPLFPSLSVRSHDDRLTVSGLQQLLQRLGTRAGVEHCYAHLPPQLRAVVASKRHGHLQSSKADGPFRPLGIAEVPRPGAGILAGRPPQARGG